jgi:anti-sigma factor RsiW
VNDDRMRRLYARGLTQHEPATRDACPSPEDLLALAEGGLPADRRDPLIDHVATCGACHREFALCRATVAGTPRPAARVSPWWGLAAAVTLAAAGAGWWALGRQGAEPVRGDAPGLEVVGPGPTAGPDRVEFRWRAVAGATGYEVRIGSPGAVPRSLGTTLDTVYVPVESLAPGRYEWIVRALFSDGRALRSAPRRLTVTP